ncbi:YoaK family protein [Clostridium nigeriense]|uniref:YoaK family protein n=1 Tax=Clostridium nigeriense TaxID=1805470 RepID=UPI003D33E712
MEREKVNNKMSESFILAILLAMVGGFLDAYTYCCRDKVFANAQTGNIVRVGITLANGEYMKTFRYFIPIIAFSLGVLITMYIRDNNNTHLHWRQVILLFEAIIIIIVSLMPIQTYLNIVSNIMISFLCAMQAESFKKVLGKPFSSTMCTGNLRRGTEYLYNVLKNNDIRVFKNVKYYFLIIISFILGAVLGRISSNYFFEKAILLTLIPLFYSIFIMINSSKKIKNSVEYNGK